MRRYSSGPLAVAILLLASVLPIIYATVPAMGTGPQQFGVVDIFTNKGGRGPNEYGGSFIVGEALEIYVYSSFDGVAYITVYEPGGSVVNIEPFSIYAGQVLGFSTTASNPPGASQLVLEVCPSGGIPTMTTYLLVPPQEAGFVAGSAHTARNPPVGCASDTTWVDVIGGPADLVFTNCRVVPSQPKQEDPMTFYARVANIGGSNAYNFRLETYLDGSLYDSGRLSLRAGESLQASSDRPWIAEDGLHTVRWVANSDHSVQESNYGNNEASCSFFVSPRTVTFIVTVTKTSTRTQTHRTDTTIAVATLTVTRTRITLTTVQKTTIMNTVTARTTLSGLVTSTIYSPTSTITVVAPMIVNPLWILLTFVITGLLYKSSNSGKLRKVYSIAGTLLEILNSPRFKGSRG